MSRGKKALIASIGICLTYLGLPVISTPLQERLLCLGSRGCRTWGGEWTAVFITFIFTVIATLSILHYYKAKPKNRNKRKLFLIILLTTLGSLYQITINWYSYFKVQNGVFEFSNNYWIPLPKIISQLQDIKQIQVSVDRVFAYGGINGGRWYCQREARLIINNNVINLRNLGLDGTDPTNGSLIKYLSRTGIPITISKAQECLSMPFPAWITNLKE
jgi:hypothetical protein